MRLTGIESRCRLTNVHTVEFNCYIPSKVKEKTYEAMPKGKKDTNKPGLSQPGTSTQRPGSHPYQPRSSSLHYMDQATNTDSVGFSQDHIFTRSFIIQWLIVVCTFVVCGFCLTLYVRHIQVHYLSESLNDILNVTEDGQSYVDTGINKEMGVRIPVLMSNGTPTIINEKVTKWVDQYINAHLPDLVSSLLKTQHKPTVEDKSKKEVRKLVKEIVGSTETAEKIHELVKQSLTKYHDNNGKTSTPMVQKQIEEKLKGVINVAIGTYIDQQITGEGPEAVKAAIETEKVMLKLRETLNAAISKHVAEKSPQMIEHYANNEALIQNIDSKLKDLLNKQLELVDMTGKVEEVLVKERLSHKITELAVDILEHESANEADPRIKKKFDELIKSYSQQFDEGLGKMIQDLESELRATKAQIAIMKKDLDVQKQESMAARQDKQANLLVLLAIIVIVLLLFVFWLYQRPYTKHSTAATTSVPVIDLQRPSKYDPWTSPYTKATRRNLEETQVQKRSNLPIGRNTGASVAQNQNLKDKACIILFNAKLQGEITKLLEDLKMPDFQYEFRTIRNDEDIPMLPRCKVFLMVCEFTKRHVIIEQKGLGLEDLHRNTYDKTIEIHGNLIILYIHDPGSRKLGDGEPYNENIHCVKSQPELSDLRDTGSFFSYYNQLTDFQSNKLREKLK